MPTFRYSAYGPQGEFDEGSIDAASPDQACELLYGRGLTPFRLRQTGQEPWWRRDLFSHDGARGFDLVAFTREFATLVAADIPLDDVLAILCGQSTFKGAVIVDLRADVLNGMPLSDAMRRRPSVFPTDYVSMVRAGEMGRSAGTVFNELADLLERRQEVRTRIRSALVYPAILIGLAFVSLGVIVGVLIPSIASIFVDSGKPQPLIIRLVLGVQSQWAEILTATAAVGTAAAFAIWQALRRPGARLAVDRVKLRLPLIGAFILQQETARFARTLGTLLRAGVPLLSGLHAARAVLANRQLAGEVGDVIDRVRDGLALHRALKEASSVPDIAGRMISVGEDSGKVDWMLLRVATMLEQQTQNAADRFMTALTPALTVFMAALVGSLIMAVFDAVMTMNDLVSQ